MLAVLPPAGEAAISQSNDTDTVATAADGVSSSHSRGGRTRGWHPGGDDLPAIVRWKIRSWEDSDEYPDMLAQSYLLGWKAYLRAVSQGARSPVAVAAAFARYGPLEWLDCWLGHKGSLRQQYEHISLDSIYDEEALDWESALLTRLEAERLWRLVRQRCSDLEGEVLRRVILEGESYVKCSRAVGISRQRVSEIYYRALCKCREALR